jgi:hypothetical protein
MRRGKFKAELLEEAAEEGEGEDEAKSAKFQDDYDIDPIVRKVNSELIYNIKSDPSEYEKHLSDTFRKASERANVTPTEATESLL